jgi:hypothetical protein
MPLLTVMAILIALSAAAAIKLLIVVATANRQPTAISTEELHQQIDVRSVPALPRYVWGKGKT